MSISLEEINLGLSYALKNNQSQFSSWINSSAHLKMDTHSKECVMEAYRFGQQVNQPKLEEEAFIQFTDDPLRKEHIDYLYSLDSEYGDLVKLNSLLSNGHQESEANSPPVQPASLAMFALNGESAKMRTQMLDDKFILKDIAILGQMTVIYAKPNAGKTLLTLWLIVEAIRDGELNGEDVFYVNADDNYKGLITKLEMAEQAGFLMMANGHNGFKPDMFFHVVSEMIKDNSCSGKVIILDTLKKFTNLMNKETSSKFGEMMRQFVLNGGSVIMLAHTNKHRDDEGGLIFQGTSDIVDDCDCAYTLDTLAEEQNTGIKTVKFERFKARGDTAAEVLFSYNYADKVHYLDRFESICRVSEDDAQKAKEDQKVKVMLEKNSAAIEAIKAAINDGIKAKTELIKSAQDRSGISRPKITKILDEHTGSSVLRGQYWHVRVGERGVKRYELNYSA